MSVPFVILVGLWGFLLGSWCMSKWMCEYVVRPLEDLCRNNIEWPKNNEQELRDLAEEVRKKEHLSGDEWKEEA